ncbi:MAG: Ig-like domain-containing protein [Firmicutes bacterium]|nr:Ig-like domain-containing protein [Bacillota bacterium]
MQQIVKRSFVFLVVLIVGLAMSFSFNVGNVSAAAKAKSITLKATSTTVDIGGTVTVKVSKVKPAKAAKKVKWSVKKGGKFAKLKSKKASSVVVQGKKAGTITIKATAKKGKATKTIKIKVKDLHAKEIIPSEDEVLLQPGNTHQVEATVIPPTKDGYKEEAITWETGDATVATVDENGLITGVAQGKTKVTVSSDGASADVVVNIPKLDSSRPFTLVGQYQPDVIDYVKVAEDATVEKWDSTAMSYLPAENNVETIWGNFAKLEDTDNDGAADKISVVDRADSQSIWDKDMVWEDGIQQGPEQAMTTEFALSIYDKEYRIPFGERQLSEFGVTDYSGTSDFANFVDSPYWTDVDYYNAKSGGSLTLLEGYKTQSQSTGWACVMTSAVSVLEWYGLRGDLNERDLASLRGVSRSRFFQGTSLNELEKMYDNLTALGIGTWNYIDSNNSDPEETFYNPEWIKEQLSLGHPIQVIWNSFGAHGQVIIGYDDMGTETTADDQVILMDPYDTTDHDADGYVVQSYERLIYGVLSWEGELGIPTKYMAVWPEEWQGYTPSTTGGIPDVDSNHLSDAMKTMNLNDKLFGLNGDGPTQADIQTYYSDFLPYMEIYPNGLSGAALPEDWQANYDKSPYYIFNDFTDPAKVSPSLKMVKDFNTVQQATEWTCGCTSSLMVLEYFDKNADAAGDPLETEISISSKRQDGAPGGTYLKGVRQVFEKIMKEDHNQNWILFDKNDLDDPEGEESYLGNYCLQAGSETPGWDGLIPYLIDNNIPMMIGSDEWGGHWQVIVGYDSMGTEGTQDDVLVIADPYDTTDHAQEGLVIKGFERLVYGWGCAFEAWEDEPVWGAGPEAVHNDFVIAIPVGYSPETDAVIAELGGED